MKTCISIKSFCDTVKKQEILIRCISTLKEKTEFPIILHSSFNLPSEIVSMVDFYIYYRNSCYATNMYNQWRTIPSRTGIFRSFVTDYGFAEMKQVLDVAHFANVHDFSIVHTINYDIDIDQLFSENSLIENHSEMLNGSEACFHTVQDFYMGLLFYSYKVSAVLKFESLIKTTEDWKNLYERHHPYLAENGFFSFFSKLNHKITKKNFLFNDLIQSKGVEYSGIPEEFNDFIETAGIYRKNYDLSNGCVLFIAFKDFDFNRCQIRVENGIANEIYNVSKFFNVDFSQYPSTVKIKIDSNETDLFPEWKMEEMKERLTYDDI